MPPVRVYIETGNTRVFASAVDWPGWARSGKTEDAAIARLLEYAPRYAAVVAGHMTGFKIPAEATVIDRARGGAGTDFGAPNHRFATDDSAIADTELRRQLAALRACWDAFAGAVRAAAGIELRRGPRGGGRDLGKLVAHVLEAEVAYVTGLGGKPVLAGRDTAADLEQVHEVFCVTLEGRRRGSIPAVGPRGGARWPLRFALRYTAWHALDHAWEIEDRRLPL
jgi:hypothetical protein